MNVGPIEAVILALSLVSAVWVFYDSQRNGYDKIPSAFWALFTLAFIFPLGFIVYFIKTRFKRLNDV